MPRSDVVDRGWRILHGMRSRLASRLRLMGWIAALPGKMGAVERE